MDDDESQGPYVTLGRDALQTLVRNANPPTARQLCQANRYTRQTCNQQLSIPEKTRICLKDGEAAKECDKIPMITEQQFKLIIPKNIEVFADDPLQLRREFYSQLYKLTTDGFTEALYKAKLMNTICALLRPDINLEYSPVMPQLPLYVDAGIVRLNDQLFRAVMKLPHNHFISVRLYDKILPIYTNLNHTALFRISFISRQGSLIFSGLSLVVKHEDQGVIQTYVNGFNDPFIGMYSNDIYLRKDKNRIGEYLTRLVINTRMGDEFELLNVFRISRMLKILFDLGICKAAKLTIENTGDKDNLIQIPL